MTTPSAADLQPGRLRLWSNWLWILAGILGAAVLWSSVRLVHDERLRRETLRLLAQDKAREVANLGAARFSLLVSDAFGPVFTEAAGQRDFIADLGRAQRERVGCKCRETLPITRFFRFDASTSAPFNAATRRLLLDTVGTADALPDSTIIRLSTERWTDGMASTRPVQHVDIVRSLAVITVTRPSDWHGGTKVYGAVVPVADLAAALFGAFPREVPSQQPRSVAQPVVIHDLQSFHAAHMAHYRRLVQLDTLGMGVAADSQPIFGTLADRPYTGSARLPAPLERLQVRVALMGSQVSMSLLLPFAHDRLWLNGMLVLSTIVVCLFAVGASRREVQLARARSDFIAGVSHDLRMPLAQILLAGETLRLNRERSTDERNTLTSSILREARRLNAMIDNVLLFSRTSAVGLEPQLTRVDLSRSLNDARQSVELAVLDARQSIVVNAETGIQATADRTLLHQAIVNLLDNAMKYGPEGQVIRLTAERAGSRAVIAVEDEGPGIPAAARERLFEAYERLERDATSERTGSGLGLAVVHQIVLACGGAIRIDGAPNGTRIVIELNAA